MNPVFSVSDFVAVFNQTIEYVYPTVTIVGELANFRVSKNKWVYFDLKDEVSSLKFFGTIYSLPGPLEDGLMLQVVGTPRLHQTYGFSVTVSSIAPVGVGSIKKASSLLQEKLSKEGLFNPERKRKLPYPPSRIGLITSSESAAYHDFNKILGMRWGGIEIIHTDVQVQGETAPAQIVEAIVKLNNLDTLDVIVVTRGGGSADDLKAFNNEQVVRTIASSRVPTLVAIGHEVDSSLSELAADMRASTPSNAAEILVPDRAAVIRQCWTELNNRQRILLQQIDRDIEIMKHSLSRVEQKVIKLVNDQLYYVKSARQILYGFDPHRILKAGYVAVRKRDLPITSAAQLKTNDSINLRFIDGTADAVIRSINPKS